ncbi:MAG: hypothetical protein M5R37_14720 [Melioribacteraceae bacterium]|nr:hypothetical protein [Melioribacteraceae bacterium]
MKKLLALILIGVFVIIGCGEDKQTDKTSDTDKVLKETTGMTQSEIETEANAVTVSKKYPIKSGIITFERKGIIGTQKIIVYFDDYGIKERSETYNEDGSLDEIKFSDGENMYIKNKYSEDEKVFYIMGPGKFGTEMKFEPDPFKNDAKRAEKYKFKKQPNMNILGKDCEAYSTTISMGTTTFAGCDGILLYTKAELSIGISETIAVDFKEDVEVDPSMFRVPEGYKTQKS